MGATGIEENRENKGLGTVQFATWWQIQTLNQIYFFFTL